MASQALKTFTTSPDPAATTVTAWRCTRCRQSGEVHSSPGADITELVHFDHRLRQPSCIWDEYTVKVRRVTGGGNGTGPTI